MSQRTLANTPRVVLDEETALEYSIRGLRDLDPLMSASVTFTAGQIGVLLGLFGAIVASLALWPTVTCTTVVGIMIGLYVITIADRVALFASGLNNSRQIVISDAEARSLDEESLPIYTVLVPAFNEPEIVGQLVRNLGQLDYPTDRLEIMLLLEVNDELTITRARAALESGVLPVDIVLVPEAEPQTKPKACNFGLQYARGEITTIYDAEDHPDPLQLRRVVAALAQLPPEYACIQAKLAYHNDRQNLLTKWFATEYDQWFGFILPGLMNTKAPIPLGGTSNHVKTDVLKNAGAWDPFNVTEDADLGMRIARQGFRTAVLDSITLEEANSDPINWIRQRSRWYKGYLQTFLVHTRRPRTLVRELGWSATARFVVLMVGTPIAAVTNALFWGLTLAWELGAPPAIRVVFPPLILYLAATCLIVGNAAVVAFGLVSIRVRKKPHLLVSALTVPLYWVLMSAAAMKALFQLIVQPSYWEKTVHGLDSHTRAT